MKENNPDGILFYASSKKDEATGQIYRKHLYFNRKENTFEHTKSCELVKGIEQCETASH